MLSQLLTEIEDTKKDTASRSLNNILNRIKLQQELRIAEKQEDNQYNECCGFGRLYLEQVEFNLSFGYSLATSRDYAIQYWNRTVFDALYMLDD